MISCRATAQTSGPERRPHRDLALTRFGARQQEVGDVGAGDEQQEADGAEEQPDRAAHAADDFIAQRQHDDVELHLRRVESLLRHRLRDSRASRRAPARRSRRPSAARRRRSRGCHGSCWRCPTARASTSRSARDSGSPWAARNPRGITPIDLVRRAVDLDRAADDRRIAGIAALPQPVPDHDDLRTVLDIFLRREHASANRRRRPAWRTGSRSRSRRRCARARRPRSGSPDRRSHAATSASV